MRRGERKSALCCGHERQRQHWTRGHRAACNILAVTLLGSSASVATAADPEPPLVEAASVETRGAAGWEHFAIDGKDYLAVANFFTSSPGRTPNMDTESMIYRAELAADGKLHLDELQGLHTTGAHGVVHLEHEGSHFVAIPNYYGKDTVVFRWDSGEGRFAVHQRIKSDGAGGVDAFTIGEKRILAIAEFSVGEIALYALSPGQQRFEPWQRVAAPGCGATATLRVEAEVGGEALLLLAASYVTQQTGWRTRSPIFALNVEGTAFEKHGEVVTVGAHDVAVTSVGGRHFAFFSNDKDERTTKQLSELFEWEGLFPSGGLRSRQTVSTDGAHAAEFFSSADGERRFLAVANLGDRKANTYRRESVVYAFDPASSTMLAPIQTLQTHGATDFKAFAIGGTSFLAVSNEQDDAKGGNVPSTLWRLRQAGDESLGGGSAWTGRGHGEL